MFEVSRAAAVTIVNDNRLAEANREKAAHKTAESQKQQPNLPFDLPVQYGPRDMRSDIYITGRPSRRFAKLDR